MKFLFKKKINQQRDSIVYFYYRFEQNNIKDDVAVYMEEINVACV